MSMDPLIACDVKAKRLPLAEYFHLLECAGMSGRVPPVSKVYS